MEIKIEFKGKEDWVAEALHDLASEIECGDLIVPIYEGETDKIEWEGSNATAIITKVKPKKNKVALLVSERTSLPEIKLVPRKEMTEKELREKADKRNHELCKNYGYGAFRVVIVTDAETPMVAEEWID